MYTKLFSVLHPIHCPLDHGSGEGKPLVASGCRTCMCLGVGFQECGHDELGDNALTALQIRYNRMDTAERDISRRVYAARVSNRTEGLGKYGRHTYREDRQVYNGVNATGVRVSANRVDMLRAI